MLKKPSTTIGESGHIAHNSPRLALREPKQSSADQAGGLVRWGGEEVGVTERWLVVQDVVSCRFCFPSSVGFTGFLIRNGSDIFVWPDSF